MRERKGRNVTQTKQGCLGSLLGVVEQHIPSDLSLSCKKQQAKACWKCCKKTKKGYRNFCVYTEISNKQI
jgi:hypothetical protein